jgi:hypothetical protein
MLVLLLLLVVVLLLPTTVLLLLLLLGLLLLLFMPRLGGCLLLLGWVNAGLVRAARACSGNIPGTTTGQEPAALWYSIELKGHTSQWKVAVRLTCTMK